MSYKTLFQWIIILNLICLFGCSQQSDLSSNPSTETLKGEIIVWQEIPFNLTGKERDAAKKRVEDVIDDFHETYPNINILGDFFELRQALDRFIVEVQRGAGADLLLVETNSKLVELIKSGILQPLDENKIDQSIFRPKALQEVRYRDKLYGIPLFLSTQVLCYNTDKVKNPVQTLSDLVQQARKGYSVGLISGFAETFWGVGAFAQTNLQSDTQLTLSEIFRKTGWIKWMEWLKKAQYEPNFIVSNDEEALKNAFIRNQLAYLTCPSEWVSQLRSALGKNKVGITLLPRETYPATPLLRTWLLIFNPASSPNQNLIAFKLAQFLTNTEQQRKLESQEIFIPSNKSISLDPRLYPTASVLMKQSQSSVAFSLDQTEKLRMVGEAGEQLYNKVLIGEIEVEAAAHKLANLIKRQSESQEGSN